MQRTPELKIAAAQLEPQCGDLRANIDKHVRLIELAVLHGDDVLVFPELSITGYAPKLAQEMAISPDDVRLDTFQRLSDTHRIVLGVGVPTPSRNSVRISLLIFQPDTARLVYSKQQLHADELPWFTPGNEQLLFKVDEHLIAPGICYESLQSSHSDHAAHLGANYYVASVAKSAKGVAAGYAHYPLVARKHAMPVLMANSIGPADDFICAGQSAVWDSLGELRGQLDASIEGILLFDTRTQAVIVAGLEPSVQTGR